MAAYQKLDMVIETVGDDDTQAANGETAREESYVSCTYAIEFTFINCPLIETHWDSSWL